jgi:hypothetical protein
MKNEFAVVRDLLGKIRTVVGYRGLVGIAWNGDKLRVSHSIPDSNKPMMVMTFDQPEDYFTDTNLLLLQFIKASAEHFADDGTK